MRSVKFINFTVFFIWLGLVCLVLYRNYTGAMTAGSDALSGVIDKAVYWYDIYHGQKKTGYASITYEKVGDEIIVIDERQINVVKNGQDTVLFQKIKCLCAMDYSLKSIEYYSQFKDEEALKATGEAGPDSILFFLESAKLRKTFITQTRGKKIYLPATFIPYLTKKMATPASSFSISILDINMLSVMDMHIVLEDILPLRIGINPFSLYKFKAGDSIWWANEKGIIEKEFNPSGAALFAQSEKFSLDFSDRLLLDHSSLPVIKSNKLIPYPEKLSRLKVMIKGFKLDPHLYEESRAKRDNQILVIENDEKAAADMKTFKIPYEGEQLQRYIKPDKWVASDYEPLKKTGMMYAKAYGYNGFGFSYYLTGYVDILIKPNLSFFISDSRDILKTLSGDFAEETIMFATYARAGGLPTRLVGGLVYVHGYFYFHTWPEVWLGQWVPADPTFSQFPADVTHIPLREGTMEDIISLVNDLKDIKIEILEAL